MGKFKRIWSEGKLLGSMKSLYKERKACARVEGN